MQLRTATTTLVLGECPEGLTWDDWYPTDGEPRPWPPSDPIHSWEMPVDNVPLTISSAGSRQLRGAEVLVDHGNGWLGARLEGSATLDRRDDGKTATLVLADTDATVRVEQRITASTAHDVVRIAATITNTGDHELRLTRAWAGAVHLPLGHVPEALDDVARRNATSSTGVRVHHLAGSWGTEFMPLTTELTAGEFSIGFRAGFTGPSHAPVLVLEDPSGSRPGAWGVQLAHCGSWRMLVDAVPLADRVRVTGGVDDETGVVTLAPGESFEAAELHVTWSPAGVDGVSDAWHDFHRAELARHDRPLSELHPVQYNSWYATTFDVSVENQTRLARVAADLGAELFVVDDGWFRGRRDDHAGLGDWTPDPAKFPRGLTPLIDAVTALGMRFGLWVEPECVNPDSDLYRAHPDWVYRAGDRPLVMERNQLSLDFGRPEVVAFTKDWLRALLAENDISYLKWDMNKAVSDGGRPGDPRGAGWAVQHVDGYLGVLQMIRDEFPHVVVETCASGGGRIDHRVLSVTDVAWTSDETGPRDRLRIQDGFLRAFSPAVMSSWVTDAPDVRDTMPVTPEFRHLVSMCGVLGLGQDLRVASDESLALTRAMVARYLPIRETVLTGRVRRHGSVDDDRYAVSYVDADHTVVMAFARPGGGREAGAWTVPVTGVDGERRDVEVTWALATDCDLVVLG